MHSRKQPSVTPGDQRETSAIEPLKAMDLRADVLARSPPFLLADDEGSPQLPTPVRRTSDDEPPRTARKQVGELEKC
jgi:hypothetical protein